MLSLSHFQHWSLNIIKRLDRGLTDGRRIYGNCQGRDCTIYLSRFHFMLGIIRISTYRKLEKLKIQLYYQFPFNLLLA